ncbi:hypothetical protein Q5M85_00995 [Paraclostridium bifermentans]|nr:hypothetical protein [Paraclostridium bifermentans]
MDIDVENEILKVIIKEVGHKTKSLLSFDKVWVKRSILKWGIGT